MSSLASIFTNSLFFVTEQVGLSAPVTPKGGYPGSFCALQPSEEFIQFNFVPELDGVFFFPSPLLNQGFHFFISFHKEKGG